MFSIKSLLLNDGYNPLLVSDRERAYLYGFKTEIIDDGQSLPTVTSYLNKEGMKTDNVYAVENIYIGESEDNHVLRMTKILVTETINQQTVQHIDIIEY